MGVLLKVKIKGGNIMFYLLLVLAVGLIVLGIVWCEKWRYEGIGVSFAFIGVVYLLVMVLVWPINYFTSKSFVVATYPALVNTIENSRMEEMGELERAALTTKILDINGDIARMQYWSQTMWKPLYYTKVMELEPLK